MRKLLLAVFLISAGMYAQNDSISPLKIYYNCRAWECFTDYLKQNLQGVEFVRDRHYADVHILVTSEANGGGGEVYYFEFIPSEKEKDVHEKLRFSVNPDMTKEQIRKKFLDYIRAGLIPFWMNKGLDDKLRISWKESAKKSAAVKDKWNHWVFRLSANGMLNGDENRKSFYQNYSVSANQVLKKNKFYFSLHYNNNASEYHYNDRIIRSYREGFGASASQIFGINEHWSYAFFEKFRRSVFANYRYAADIKTGLEYNIFPYAESTKHALTITERIGPVYNKYFERTVFNKTEDFLWTNSLDISLSFIKTWGDYNLGITYDVFLHNPRLNAVNFSGSIDLRLIKGLSFHLSGYYSITHNQINISGTDLTLEEMLLSQRQLMSGYNYFVYTGFSYTFGSIYNTIVNPRF